MPTLDLEKSLRNRLELLRKQKEEKEAELKRIESEKQKELEDADKEIEEALADLTERELKDKIEEEQEVTKGRQERSLDDLAFDQEESNRRRREEEEHQKSMEESLKFQQTLYKSSESKPPGAEGAGPVYQPGGATRNEYQAAAAHAARRHDGEMEQKYATGGHRAVEEMTDTEKKIKTYKI